MISQQNGSHLSSTTVSVQDPGFSRRSHDAYVLTSCVKHLYSRSYNSVIKVPDGRLFTDFTYLVREYPS